jgi:thymidylate synthase
MMPRVIEIDNGVTGYVDVVRWVHGQGSEVSPRGMLTREIEDALILIEDPYSTLPIGTGRGTVPGIGAIEACQLLGGVSDPELVIAVGPQFANYTEDNGLFHGAYGLRTDGQYSAVIERLKNDPDSRQAVVTIWNPSLDLLPSKRDYPCTVLHQFRVRNGALNMSVYMRSNDVWLGAAYDWFQFTRVQIAMASVLGVEVGRYAHHVGSLHIYEQHFDKVSSLRYPTYSESQATSYDIPVLTGDSWQEVSESARRCLLAARSTNCDGLSKAELWYARAMISSVESNQRKRQA